MLHVNLLTPPIETPFEKWKKEKLFWEIENNCACARACVCVCLPTIKTPFGKWKMEKFFWEMENHSACGGAGPSIRIHGRPSQTPAEDGTSKVPTCPMSQVTLLIALSLVAR